MVRVKMPREMRAKQFAPFDALKGLHDALRLKEYEHERVEKGDLSEEKIQEISAILQNLKKTDVVKIVYYRDGHNLQIEGCCKLDFNAQNLEINKLKISFYDILNITKSTD